MTDILDQIDRATGCQECGGPLGGSPSDDFCREECQAAWRAKRVGAEVASLYEHYRSRVIVTSSEDAQRRHGDWLSMWQASALGWSARVVLPERMWTSGDVPLE